MYRYIHTYINLCMYICTVRPVEASGCVWCAPMAPAAESGPSQRATVRLNP